MSKILAVVVRELRAAALPFVFFAVILGLGRLSKLLLLEEYHLTFGGTAVALIGALIMAKAILVADALPISRVFSDRPLVVPILWKAALYAVITMVFRYLEELIPLVRESGGVVAAHEQLVGELSWPHFWVVQLWVVFALVLYCTSIELTRAVGPDRIRALMFGRGGVSR